jgi:hypothetical protein
VHRAEVFLPLDYPRINQFPEWFVAEAERRYTIAGGGDARTVTGKEMQDGVPLELKPGVEVRWRVKLAE